MLSNHDMISLFFAKASALVVACAALWMCGAGCAMRATTDFGPQSQSSTRSLSVGPEGLPGNVSGVSGPDGDSIGLRPNGDLTPGGSGSSPASGSGGSGMGGSR